ncbi:hypothetical protein TRIUR3_17786 [Triticum urartu]|uniref:Zinc finger LSD1-type domain-containing protein n=1 Tax=Triticum urartu TaxID=4572 RepID=M7YNX6_TRIUA|nr:hypothetical protein TRIUR3_17786 [Triticum urartu]
MTTLLPRVSPGTRRGERKGSPDALQEAVEMAQLICGGCRTLLMYTRNADTVRCSCCSTVNLVRPVNNIAHVNCGRCRTTLMYPHGAPSVKCAICDYITNITNTGPTPQPQNVTVVVENPMTVDEKGKLPMQFYCIEVNVKAEK